MLTWASGLISPEALTTADKSWRCTFPLCTVTKFLLLWWTVMPTIMANTTAAPTPIAIFFQGFIVPVTVRGALRIGPTQARVAEVYSQDSLYRYHPTLPRK